MSVMNKLVRRIAKARTTAPNYKASPLATTRGGGHPVPPVTPAPPTNIPSNVEAPAPAYAAPTAAANKVGAPARLPGPGPRGPLHSNLRKFKKTNRRV